MKNRSIKYKIGVKLTALITGTLLLFTGCNKFLDIPLPANQVAADGAFLTNASTGSVLTGIYYNIVNGTYFSGGSGIGYTSSLYTDDLINLNPAAVKEPAFYTDNLQSADVTSIIWNPVYTQIYACNLAIEGINNSTALLTAKNQFLGEAYFTRSWLYFNLVNVYGAVPLALKSDYQTNNKLSRSAPAEVYAQIIADLKMAISLLPADYHDAFGNATTSRARPNQFAAMALLARVYLYTGDMANAEAQATNVINNSVYKLTDPSQTFLIAGNTESIWGLPPTGTFYVNDYNILNGGMPATIPAGKTIISYGVNAALTDSAVNNFEPGDARFTNWVRQTFDPATAKTYYFPNKFKSNVNGVENMIPLRLAEQYLIRAEARAKSNIAGSQADLDVVRTRAGLPATTAATTAGLLTAILKERRSEFFTEQGHRFFDLKRTGNIDAVMAAAVAQKNVPGTPVTWNSQKQLWPISSTDIIANPKLVQNPGYQ